MPDERAEATPRVETEEQLGQKGKELIKQISERVKESGDSRVSLGEMEIGEVRGCLAVGGKPYPERSGEPLVFDEQTRTIIGFQVEKTKTGYECTLAVHRFDSGKSPLAWSGDKASLNDNQDLGEIFSASEIDYHTAGKIGQSFFHKETSFGVEFDGKMWALKFSLENLVSPHGFPLVGSNLRRGVELAFSPGADLSLENDPQIMPVSRQALQMIRATLGEITRDQQILKTWESSSS